MQKCLLLVGLLAGAVVLNAPAIAQETHSQPGNITTAQGQQLAQTKETPSVKQIEPLRKSPPSKQLIIEGNKIKTIPGYKLQSGGNQVAARAIGGTGGLGLTADCKCTGGTGDCNLTTSGDTAVCSRAPGSPCNGSCGWKINMPKARSRVMQ